METQSKSFSSFTNLYELSKTLRFELNPVGETQKLLDENQVFLTDKIRQKKYEEIKPFLDEFHGDFIKFCLWDLSLDFQDYKESLNKYQKDKKSKEWEKRKQISEKNLRESIREKFDSKVIEFLETFWKVEIFSWKKEKIKVVLENIWEIEFSKNNHEFLFEIWIFDLMKKKFEWKWDIYVTNKETWEIYKNKKTWKDITIFDDWNGWLGYLTKFFKTRKNLYKSDTSTALATRIIDQNLKKYCNNLDIYKKLLEREELKNRFKILEEDFWINLEDFFSLGKYNGCILQSDIQKYNDIIWWKVVDKNKKIPWINEHINKYRQDSWEKLSFLEKLDKQILAWWKDSFIEQIKDEEDFKNILSDFYNDSVKKVEILTQIFENLKNYNEEDYKTIYFSKEAFNTLSHKFTDQVLVFEKLVFEELLQYKLVEKKHFDKKEEKYKFPDFIALYYIKKWLEKYSSEDLFYKLRYYENEIIEKNSENIWNKFCSILSYEFKALISNKIINQNGEEVEIWFDISKDKLEKILDNFSLWEKNNGAIKDFADIARNIYQMWKYFALEKKREWNPNDFYTLNRDFYSEWIENKSGYGDFYNEAYEQIIVPYNLMRNFIAKKPWEDSKKWKLNFENSSLLKGWDKEFESYWAYIFEKEWLYYLWLINGTKLNKEEIEKLYILNSQNIAKRFVYDFQKPDNKNTPRLFIRSKWDSFAPAVEELNLPINDIIDIYDNELYKTDKNNPNTHRESLEKLIDYFKLWFSKHKSYKHFNFVWKESSEYKNIADFYRDVEKSCYKPYWEDINFDELKNLTKEKRVYLFQIYNKNFELDKSIAPENYIFKWNGRDNVHTMYFKWVFSKYNIENISWVNIKLSWWWEIFFRPRAIDEEIDVKRKTKRDVIKNKRYTQEKIFLHFPIQVNFKENKALSFNNYVNNFLANNPNINIIWIDRWEKHLAYYSVINRKQEIIESGSLNYIYQKDKDWNIIKKSEKEIKEKRNSEWKIIDYELVETWKMLDYEDYKILLDYKEKKRKLQRQSWKEVEQIKDLKKWYISAVVRKIADLIIEHNAIVVFEDLNMRFKQIRWWIEKSTYQQLEKALIDKLNFLVNKWKKNPEEAGNLLKAFQLTAPVWTFKDMWKQTWIIFYTQASYTSKIDPVTGWRPNLYIKKQKSEINKSSILKFDSIVWNSEKHIFEITYDLEKFKSENTKKQNDKKEEKLNKTKWTLSTWVERYKWNRYLNNNKWWYEYFADLSHNFKEHFENYWINIFWNILDQIEKLGEKWNEKFFSGFLDLFKLVCQIRNTNKDEKWNENDFILSPVYPFFDSRKENNIWVKNWDDNWAYNIARKWIIILEKLWDWKKENDVKIKNWEKEIYPDLFVSNIAWDNFTQNNR